jgi:hypothetical protein
MRLELSPRFVRIIGETEELEVLGTDHALLGHPVEVHRATPVVFANQHGGMPQIARRSRRREGPAGSLGTTRSTG